MIRTLIHELKAGNEELPGMFLALEELWTTKLKDIDSLTVEQLAKQLGMLQFDAERICGSRGDGKAFMPWSAFAHFYSADVGYEDNGPRALKLAQAFAKSSCSMEVKSGAREAAKTYHVEDFA